MKANPGLTEPLPATVGTVTILLPSRRFYVSCCSLRPPPLPLPSPPQCEGASPASVLHRALSPPSQRLTVRLDSPNTFLTLSLPPLRSLALSPSLSFSLCCRDHTECRALTLGFVQKIRFSSRRQISSQLLQFVGLYSLQLCFSLFSFTVKCVNKSKVPPSQHEASMRLKMELKRR